MRKFATFLVVPLALMGLSACGGGGCEDDAAQNIVVADDCEEDD